MKALTTLLIGSIAASAIVLPRQGGPNEPANGQMHLSDFSFSGVRTSIYEFYRFNVTDGTNSTYCSTTTSAGPNIIQFGYTPCQDPDWSFAFFYINWTNPGPGYSLQVTHKVAPPQDPVYNQTGCLFFPQSDIKTTQDSNPNAVYQYLDAPQSFDINWTNGECVYG